MANNWLKYCDEEIIKNVFKENGLEICSIIQGEYIDFELGKTDKYFCCWLKNTGNRRRYFNEFGNLREIRREIEFSEPLLNESTKIWFTVMKECCKDKSIDGKTYEDAFYEKHRQIIDDRYFSEMDKINKEIEIVNNSRYNSLSKLNEVTDNNFEMSE